MGVSCLLVPTDILYVALIAGTDLLGYDFSPHNRFLQEFNLRWLHSIYPKAQC
jgi:hypothetical protein